MIVGSGQLVQWKGSFVTAYEKNSEGKEVPKKLEDWPEGQCILKPGDKLYITFGRVKEV